MPDTSSRDSFFVIALILGKRDCRKEGIDDANRGNTIDIIAEESGMGSAGKKGTFQATGMDTPGDGEVQKTT